MDKVIGIYTIQNKLDNKIYVGQSVNVYNRLIHHRKKLRANNHDNEHLQNAYNKYGEESFLFELLVECDDRFLNSEEAYWCNILNCYDNNYGYNLVINNPNGSNKRLKKETIEKMVKNRNYVMSEENKALLRLRLSTPEAKAKLSMGALKRTGIKQTQEHIQKRLKYHIGVKRDPSVGRKIAEKMCIKTIQMSLNGDFIKEWESLTSIKKELGYDMSLISRVCIGKGNTAYGYKWAYKKDLIIK